MALFDTTEQLTFIDRPPHGTAWIACRVCNTRSAVALDNPALLCHPCRTDLEMTKQHVAYVLEAIEARWRVAYDAFDVQAAQPEVAERWAAVQAARMTVDPALFAKAWQRRKAEGGAFGALLVAREELDTLSEEVARVQEWARFARQEIDAAEQG